MVERLDGHCDRAFGITFASSGEQIMSSSMDGTVHEWGLDPPENNTLQSSPEVESPGGRYHSKLLVGHRSSIYSVAITPDGHHAVSGSRDLGVRLWDLTTGRTDIQLYGPRDAIIKYTGLGLIYLSHRYSYGTRYYR
jgi:WD40 repeat protein